MNKVFSNTLVKMGSKEMFDKLLVFIFMNGGNISYLPLLWKCCRS